MEFSKDYLAGLFDGEGWFRITRTAGSRNRSIREWAYQCHASITMRERYLVEAYQEKWGGTVTLQKSRSEKHSPYWNWRVTGLGALQFAKDMSPHLRAKKPHADVVIKFQQEKNTNGNRPVTDERYTTYGGCFELMKNLNQKGVGK